MSRTIGIRNKWLLNSFGLIGRTHPYHSSWSLWMVWLIRLPTRRLHWWCVCTFCKWLSCVLVNIDAFDPRALFARKIRLMISRRKQVSRRHIISPAILRKNHLVESKSPWVYGPERLSKIWGWACHVIITLQVLLLVENAQILYILVYNQTVFVAVFYVVKTYKRCFRLKSLSGVLIEARLWCFYKFTRTDLPIKTSYILKFTYRSTAPCLCFLPAFEPPLLIWMQILELSTVVWVPLGLSSVSASLISELLGLYPALMDSVNLLLALLWCWTRPSMLKTLCSSGPASSLEDSDWSPIC